MAFTLARRRETVYKHSMTLRTHDGSAARLAKGRGAALNPEGRFESVRREVVDDGWLSGEEDEAPPRLETHVTKECA